MSTNLAIPVPENIEKGLEGSRMQGFKWKKSSFFNPNPLILEPFNHCL
jgi:hypothetical protein